MTRELCRSSDRCNRTRPRPHHRFPQHSRFRRHRGCRIRSLERQDPSHGTGLMLDEVARSRRPRPARPLHRDRRREERHHRSAGAGALSASRCATCIRGHTPVVLRPGSVAEVSEILKLANETATAIVPQGGNTGLVGGQIPHHGEIVLSLNRLDKIREVDPVSNTITCEAGVTLAARARGRRRRRPALSAAAAVGGHLHHRRQSLDQCRRHRRARLRHRALARARPRGGAGRRPRAEQPQQAEEGQHRLRPQEPVHRRRRHARRHHRGGAAAGAAPALGRDRVRRRAVAARRRSTCSGSRPSAPPAASPASR